MKYFKFVLLFVFVFSLFLISTSKADAGSCSIYTTTYTGTLDENAPCTTRTQAECTSTPYYHVGKSSDCKWYGTTPPTVTVTPNPPSILQGQSSLITWTSTNTTSCDSGGHGVGVTGSFTVSPSTTTSYPVTCTGPGGSSDDLAVVVVTQPATVTLEFDPPRVKDLVEKGSLEDVGTSHLRIKANNLSSGSCALKNLTTGETYTPVYTNSPLYKYKDISNLNNTSTLQLQCTDASLNTAPLTVNTQSGIITAPASCDIISGQSSCNLQISLATTNPQTGVTTVAKRDAIPTPITVGSGNGTIASPTIINNVNVPFGTQIFRSFNKVDGETTGTNSDYLELYSRSIIAKCATGTAWNGTICTPPSNNNKPDLIASSPTPTNLTVGSSPTFTSAITNQGVNTTGSSFLNLFQTATGFDDALLPVGVNNYSAGSMNTLTSGQTVNATTNAISFPNAGTYYIRACADKDTSLVGTIDEGGGAYETNNCSSGWVKLTVTDPRPDLTASAPTLSSTAILNTPLTFSSTIYNNGINSTGAPFYNIFRVATAFDGGGSKTPLVANPPQMVALAGGTSAPIISASHTFTSTGNYSVQVCADNNFQMSGTINEGNNEDNNCSGWTNVTISVPVPSVTLTANPTSGKVGVVSPTLTWTTTNSPTNCYAGGSWSGSKAIGGGSQSMGTLSIVKTYTYTLYCINQSGSSNTATATVVVTAPALAPDLIISSFTPQASAPVGTVTFTATVKNDGTATTGRNFTNLFQVSPFSNGSNPSDYATTLMPTLGIGSSDDTSKSISFPTAGTYYIRACADKSSAGDIDGVIDEANISGTGETNNCSDWEEITITLGTLPPIGTLDGPDCTIAQNASTCTTSLTLSITNPVSGAATNITKNPNVVVATGITPAVKTGIVVSYPSTKFYLNHNFGTLAEKQINATCTQSPVTFWNGTKCILGGPGDYPDLTVSEVMSLSHDIGEVTFSARITNDVLESGTGTGESFKNIFQVSTEPNGAGTITNYIADPNPMPELSDFSDSNFATKPLLFTSGATVYVRACADNDTLMIGGVVESAEGNNCSDWVEIIIGDGGPTGTLSATDCTIPLNGSTCDSILNWNTINPVAGFISAVTSDYPDFDTEVFVNNSGTDQTASIPGNLGTRAFYLYHNSIPLDDATATASCIPGTSWDGTKCVTTTGICPNPKLIFPLCDQCINGNTPPNCTSVDPSGNAECALTHYDCIVGEGTPTGETVNTFFWTCYEESDGSSASCFELKSGGTTGTETPTLTFTATKSWIFKGRGSTLTWSSNADSCTGSDDGAGAFNGSKSSTGSTSVEPVTTTTYKLNCLKGTETIEKTVKVRVINPKIIEI